MCHNRQVSSVSPSVRLLAASSFCAGLLVAFSGSVRADPTIDRPPVGKGVLLVDSEDPDKVRLALVGEVVLVAILGAEEFTGAPEIGAVDGGAPELAVARVGLIGIHGALSYSLRLDLSEGLRVRGRDFSEHPGAAITRFIDDAALFWRPRSWARFALGRFKVPFSRYRQLERNRLTAGMVPFGVDRLAPDRRWGLSLYGDLGSLSYAVGGYADLDALEPRGPTFDPGRVDPQLSDLAVADPSAGGRALLAAYAWWTPVAPNGADHMALHPSDPWYTRLRPAAGIGVMYRLRPDGARLDASFATQIGYRNLAAMAEFFAFAHGERTGLAAAGQASVLLSKRFALFARGELDGGVDIFAVGGGLSYFATRDRRNKVSFVGWVRRDLVDGPKRDGAIVQLQAVL